MVSISFIFSSFWIDTFSLQHAVTAGCWSTSSCKWRGQLRVTRSAAGTHWPIRGYEICCRNAWTWAAEHNRGQGMYLNMLEMSMCVSVEVTELWFLFIRMLLFVASLSVECFACLKENMANNTIAVFHCIHVHIFFENNLIVNNN